MLLCLICLLVGGVLTPLPPRATALTDAEIGLFYANASHAVTQGTENGATMYPELSVSTDDEEVIRIRANHVPPHETASSYTQPITTYIGNTVSTYTIPRNPAIATQTTCLPTGVLGVAVNGVSIFSAYSRPCTDAVEDEAIGFDQCQGHPQEQGQYHYHYKADCLKDKEGNEVCKEKKQLLFGVLLDGFPVYNKYTQNGTEITNDQLDECHGYDAGDGLGYRYIVNDEFPYIVGCFKGTPLGQISCHCDSDTMSPLIIGLIVVGSLMAAALVGWLIYKWVWLPRQVENTKAVELKEEPEV